MNVVQRLIARMSLIPLDKPTATRVQTRESWKLRLDEWRKDETLVAESIKLARDNTYRAQLDVLRNEHPCHMVFSKMGVNPSDRLAHQSVVEGYELCLNNLEVFTKPLRKISELRETFEPVETKPTRK